MKTINRLALFAIVAIVMCMMGCGKDDNIIDPIIDPIIDDVPSDSIIQVRNFEIYMDGVLDKDVIYYFDGEKYKDFCINHIHNTINNYIKYSIVDTFLVVRGSDISPFHPKYGGIETISLCTEVVLDSTHYKLTTIGRKAFEDCEFYNINIPSSLLSIENRAFSSCINLDEIDLSSVKFIGDSAFYHCGMLKNINLKNVEYVGASAFYGCYNVSVEFSDNLKYIGSGAFTSCVGISDLTIPDGDVQISDRAFDECIYLKSLHLGKNVKSIGDKAFWGCCSLKDVVIMAKEPPALGTDVFPITNDSFYIYVPSEYVERYKSDVAWSQYKDVIKSI